MYARCITIDWVKISKAINLSIDETKKLFSDGRMSGELLQRIAIKQFNLIPSDNLALYDALFSSSRKKIEIRLITQNGLQTCPSNQKGSGRDFDKEAYLQKLEAVEYFLLIDLRSISNNIPCYLIPSTTIRRFFQKNILSKSGATASFKTIALLLMKSNKAGWEQPRTNRTRGKQPIARAPRSPFEASQEAERT